MRRLLFLVSTSLCAVSLMAQTDLCTGDFAATSNSANAYLSSDNNAGTRWESTAEAGDSVLWQMNFQQDTTFNRIKIIWEGAYAKSYDILAGEDCDNLSVIYSVRDTTLANFPQTQYIEFAQPVTARHIRFHGIQRGTQYGYSFWEFQPYQAMTTVLSGLDFSAAAQICKTGETVALTAIPRDQYDQPMSGQTISYSVAPAELGSVTDAIYTASAMGEAMITATCGTFSKTVTIFNYLGGNVALQKPVAGTGYNDSTRVNDGSDQTEFQLDPNNGGAGLDVTCGFTIDLGAAYDLNLVAIHFEGACSDAYTVETSADHETWNTAYSFTGTLGINGRWEYLHGDNLQKAQDVRYIRYTSTKNSTQWGMKIFEFQAYGTEHSTPSALNQQPASTHVQKFLRNGHLYILKDGRVYDLSGKISL